MKLLKFFLILILSNIFLNADEPIKFAHEIYQVKPHPKAKFYTLKNGFRYVLLPNQSPKNRVLIYLFVNAGSLNETDNQQGIAHYLEHMAFNGTKNYPGESMVAFFKKIGMDFGGDTNAYTDFSETVYTLNLPDEKLMNEGISIMADYAMNMLLTPEEIEKERGVILSEKRARDDIDFRIQYQNFQFVLPNSLIAKRFPIGLEESIKAFKREDFLNFYETWYRPENMVLIVVGDIDAKKWGISINKAFETFKAKSEKSEAPILKDVGHHGLKVNYYYEKEATETKVEISTVVIQPIELKSFLDKTKIELAESAANNIFNKRIAEKISQKDYPLINGYVSSGLWLKQVHSGTIEATCKPENWKASLSIIETELRKTLQFGFTDQELMLFKKDYLSQLDNAVKTMSTRESQSYINQIVGALSEGLPFLDSTQNRNLMKPLLEKLSKEDVLKEFQKYWAVDHQLISVAGNVEIINAEAEIKRVYEESKVLVVASEKETKLAQFPYESKPVFSGKIISKEDFSEFDIKRLTYSNNVVVNLKKTDFKKNEILFNISLGLGSLSEPSDKEGLSHLASIAINEGGLEKISRPELEKTLSGKNIKLSFSVEANSFDFQGEATPENLELNLQLCRAMILAPGFRNEAHEFWLKSLDHQYASIELNMMDLYQNLISEYTSGGNKSLYFPARKILEKLNMNDAKNWLLSQFKDGMIEINIVGDFDVNKTTEMLSAYFGSLPERKKHAPKILKDLALKKKFEISKNIVTKIKKSLVFITIPTVDFRQISEVRRLNLLGRILEEKTMKLIREDLAISYSPSAGHRFDQNFKNFCAIQFNADVEPQNVIPVQKAIESIIKEIYEKGITLEDLEAVRKPTVLQIKDYINTNDYWVDRVLKNSVTEPENLKFASTFLKEYEDITVDQINNSIKRYLLYENKSQIILSATIEENSALSEPIK